ncbi:MAG: hypothetical protein A3D34_03805 [Candidatus Staskawiczbacteria bacterium RIFCSPHIGHO2_02_FULL_33_16]|uniref:Uncharacterized protein n=1 Tax=Candidatus Staskawiczbacteria bacterium RIFCSPHIGHO2_02_FULL_33_16 TaxID=1802204 RepID=A0A1G2HUF2_9BACT|nr:MAG: hypothetical protein A3D34_03805 [Candidatus Staskawiczbacteria bacterium RIFCSPHIGHO2_02_FULL_33_16]
MNNSENKICQNCKKDFTIEPDDFGFYEKIGVPPPTFCSECRFQHRMMFRNDRTFYRRQCDLCKQNIIAVYPSDAPFPVYCVKCWWSDKWDPYKYGKDFDFSRPFFEQFKELLNVTPALSIMNDNGVVSLNCEYTYDWFYSKNCYMDVSGWYAENVLYSYHIEHNKDLIDSMHMRENELDYECLQCYKLFGCAYCTYCFECQNCFLSYDLSGCLDCVMCIGLRNKSYCIKNKQYTKEEYKKEIKKMNLENFVSIEKYKKEFKEFSLAFPHRHAYIKKSVNSIGDFIINCKNSKHCFMTIAGENLRYMFGSDTAKDTYDCDMTGKSELCYNSMVADEAQRSAYTVFCFHSNEVMYSHYCPSAEWCFGCVGLKKGSYSIFNKKYSKKEYEELRSKIIEHMKKTEEFGEFFPPLVSPFAYNESAAQELFPLNKNEIEAKNYKWRESDPKNYKVTIKPNDLPNTIKEISGDIVEQIIGCEHDGSCNHKCTTAFKVVPNEFILYKKLNIPIPHLCPNCRHFARLEKRNPIKLWHRKCMKERCDNEFETSYAPDRPEIVYCEKCYQQEIY